MKTELKIAQKGIVLNRKRDAILAVHYSEGKYCNDKIAGKYGLPGGQIEFGEKPDISLVREIKEETGVTVRASSPVHLWTWTYQKGKTKKQIIAVARLCFFVKGALKKAAGEKESTIDYCKWLPLKELPVNQFVRDEAPAIKEFLL